ncbi:MAG: protein kinase [Phycisphaerae bacterium]
MTHSARDSGDTIDPHNTRSSFGELAAFGLSSADDQWLRRLREAGSGTGALGLVGGYELLGEVGRGGQGIVYKARQIATGRLVAVKRLLHGAFASPTVRRRFAREVQTAARLKHANLVTVYGVEAAADPPMLVLEWIDGVPADRWARPAPGVERPLDERLRLFLSICAGVQYAHQQGVIHRDLKPGNILVDGSGAAHILDFGLAKLLNESPGEPQMTATGDLIGTPAYFAPEQVRGETDGVDTRTDVYSLGVILYDLLTGELPYPVRGSLADLLHAIQTVEPAAPSRRNRKLPRDLDIIALKSLAKDPRQRYQSVDALAEDLRRFRAGEAIHAHPPSAVYQLGKLLRKHRVTVALASLALVTIVTFAVVSTALSIQLARRSALVERQNRFLSEIFLSTNPEETAGREPTVREVLDKASRRLFEEFSDDPKVASVLHELLGSAYRALGQAQQAERHLRAAAATGAASGTRRPDETIHFLTELSAALLAQPGKAAEAEPFLRERLRIAEHAWGRTHPNTLAAFTTLADVLAMQQKHSALEELTQAQLAALEAAHGDAHPDTIHVLVRLGNLLEQRGRDDDAERVLRKAARAAHTVYGPEHGAWLDAQHALARVLLRRGDAPRAEAEFQPLIAVVEHTSSAHDWRRAVIHSDWGACLAALGRTSDAVRELEASATTLRATLGDAHSQTQVCLRRLRDALRATGANERAAAVEDLLSPRDPPDTP